MITGEQILGAQIAARGESVYRAVDPAAGVPLEPDFRDATGEEIDRAARLARRDAAVFGSTSFEDRAAFLETIADEIVALGDDLIARAGAETGLPEGRLVGERGRTVGQLRLFAEVVREGSYVDARIDTADSERKPVPKPDIRSMMIPLGPVAVFGASNFPLAFSVAGGDTASALAAGCPVIVKGHPAHPGTSEFVGRAIQSAVKRCNLPEGTFSLVQGRSNEVGAALVQHDAITAVGFTGSFRGGKALYDLAQTRATPIPVYAEMGSTNPAFLLSGALAERGTEIAAGLAASVTLGAGQFCTNPGLVFAVAGNAFDRFLDAAADEIAAKPTATMLHDGIHAAYESGFRDAAALPNVRVVAESTTNGSGTNCAGIPRLLTTDAATFLATRRLEEEIFGPATLVVRCADASELLSCARKLGGHLTATLHGTDADLETNAELASLLRGKVGRLVFNGFPTGVEVCHAMVHGGPFPATTDSRMTSVGTMAIRRFLRPVCFQNAPQALLPAALQDGNPLGIPRLVDGK